MVQSAVERRGENEQPGESRRLPLEWNVPAGVVTHYVTNLVVQFTGEEFLISFFEVRPPLIVGTPEEKRVQIARVEAVEARCLTRIAVSPGRMGEFIEVMQEQLQRAKETAAERPTTEQSR